MKHLNLTSKNLLFKSLTLKLVSGRKLDLFSSYKNIFATVPF